MLKRATQRTQETSEVGVQHYLGSSNGSIINVIGGCNVLHIHQPKDSSKGMTVNIVGGSNTTVIHQPKDSSKGMIVNVVGGSNTTTIHHS